MCRMSGFYGEDLAAIHASGFTDLALAAAGELSSPVPAPCRIVAFGCGEGTTARLLCDSGHDATDNVVSIRTAAA